MLLIEALSWTAMGVSSLLIPAGDPALATARAAATQTAPLLWVCPPFIFYGILAVLMGLVMRWVRNRGEGLILHWCGALTCARGCLALVGSHLLLPTASPDPTLASVASNTDGLVGFPFPLLGLLLLIIATVKAATQATPRWDSPHAVESMDSPPLPIRGRAL